MTMDKRSDEFTNEHIDIINLPLYHSDSTYKWLIDNVPVKLYQNASALNSLKHGMTQDNILPCRKQDCYYKDICLFVNENQVEGMVIGEPCVHELALYLQLAEGYVNTFNANTEELYIETASRIFELIMLDIKKYRISGMHVIEGGTFERPGVSYTNYKGMNLSFRYRRGLLENKIKLLEELQDESNQREGIE